MDKMKHQQTKKSRPIAGGGKEVRSIILSETDRKAELSTLLAELENRKGALKDADAGKRIIQRQIKQIKRDILRNKEMLRNMD